MPGSKIKGCIKQAIADARERTAAYKAKYKKLPHFKSQRLGRGAFSRRAAKAELAILKYSLQKDNKTKLSTSKRSSSSRLSDSGESRTKERLSTSQTKPKPPVISKSTTIPKF
jgi:hypothetical protein